MAASNKAQQRSGHDCENMKVVHIPAEYDIERDMPDHLQKHLFLAIGEATARYFSQPGVQEKFEEWVVEWRKKFPPKEKEGEQPL